MNKIYYFAICVMACLVSCNPNGGVLPEPDNGDVVPGTEDATSRKVATDTASDITDCSVVLHGNVNIDISLYEDVEFGMMVSENEEDMNARKGEMHKAKILIGKNFELALDMLIPETKYYYCAWLLLNNIQYEFGEIKDFETEALPEDVPPQSSIPFVPVNCTINITKEYPHFIVDNGFQTLTITQSKVEGEYVGYAGLLVWVAMDGNYHAADLCCPHCLKPNKPIEVDGFYAVCPICDEHYDLSWGSPIPTKHIAEEPLKRYNTSIIRELEGVKLYIYN